MDSEPNIRNKLARGKFTTDISNSMSIGKRGQVFAIGLAAFALIVFGAAWFLIARANQLEAAYQKQANAAAVAYVNRANVAIERSCRSLASAKQPQCIHEEREAARQGTHNIRQSESQAISVIWTKYTDVAVIFGTAAGAVGLLLILATFWQNKRSADAAHDANRPWLEVVMEEPGLFSINANGAALKLNFSVINRGNSPATNVLIYGSLAGRPSGDVRSIRPPAVAKVEEAIRKEQSNDRFIGSTLFPGHTPQNFRDFEVEMDADELLKARGEPHGQVSYDVAVGARYRFGSRTGRTIASFSISLTVGDINYGVGGAVLPQFITLADNYAGYAT